jgi:hypothetical protein
MYPTYLERIASMAEKACTLAIDQPGDTQAREQLFDALAAVADPAFQGDDPDLDHLSGLFSQARVWAVIVRTRIASLPTNNHSYSALKAIIYPARDLLPILVDLSRELARRHDA